MLDIETMGNSSTAAIVAVGAVFCDLPTGEIGGKYYEVVSLENNPGTIDPDTLYWWMEQSNPARRALLVENKQSALEMCRSFTQWVSHFETNNEHIRLWGNGATFDNVILNETFRAYNLPFPIKFWNNRDMRTLVGFYPTNLKQKWFNENKRDGVHHNALNDAEYQVQFCSHILKELGVKETY